MVNVVCDVVDPLVSFFLSVSSRRSSDLALKPVLIEKKLMYRIYCGKSTNHSNFANKLHCGRFPKTEYIVALANKDSVTEYRPNCQAKIYDAG